MIENYTIKEIAEILEVICNPNEFVKFIEFMKDYSTFPISEFIEDGTAWQCISPEISDAIYLYKNRDEADARKELLFAELMDSLYPDEDEDESLDCNMQDW